MSLWADGEGGNAIHLPGERGGIVVIAVLDFRVSTVRGKASEGKGHAEALPFLW